MKKQVTGVITGDDVVGRLEPRGFRLAPSSVSIPVRNEISRGDEMATIRMKREHSLGTDQIRERIEGLADKVAERLGGSWNWEEDEAVCKARGAKARIGYDDRMISVEIVLPTAMRPLRRKFEAKIDEYLVGFLEEG